MCNAWNHYSGCECGWGGLGWSGAHTTGVRWTGAYSPESQSAPFSYTNSLQDLAASLGHSVLFPTICWYCSAEIYLYANEFGSFVIFDSPPDGWHKHSCVGWTPESSNYSPPVAVRSGVAVAVPANAREDVPTEGMKLCGVVMDDRCVFNGRWIYRVVIYRRVKPGQWVEGVARRVQQRWHLRDVKVLKRTPPTSATPQNNELQRTRPAQVTEPRR